MIMQKRLLYPLLVSFFLLLSQSLFAAPNWKTVEQLLKEQKLTQAFKQVDSLLTQAKQAKDNNSWRQALIIGAVLRKDRGEYENAVNYLLNNPWPQDDQSRMLINLHFAHLLSDFVQLNSWEIQRREKISSNKKQGLKKKTMRQLVNDINQAFAKAYALAVKKDESLSVFTLQLADFKNYFTTPDYPPQVRGTIRDTVTFLWVDFLIDRSLWDARQSNQANGFTLQQLLDITYRDNLGFAKNVHPLKRLVWLLSDLEHYQSSQKKPEAAMEAFRVKIEKLDTVKSSPEDIQQLSKILKERITQSAPSLAWSNMLRDTYASLIAQLNTDDINIQRIAILKQCLAQHKKHRATKFCQRQFNKITQPYIKLTSMKSDGLKKRSLLVNHNNVGKLYFRAWKINAQQLMQNKTDQEMKDLLLKNKRKADAQWEVSLPATKDYKRHKTFIIPPMHEYGYWLIAASTQANFSTKEKKNIIDSTTLNLTRLVATSQNNGNNLEVTVYNGETGQIASKVRAELWTRNNKPSRLVKTAFTSNQGKASFKIKKDANLNLILKNGKDFTLVDRIYTYSRGYSQQVKQSLIFTDRAIYRPDQKILWKVVAYKGDGKKGKYSVFPNSQGLIKLFDANGKLVQEKKVKTNQYGSVSGEFIAKSGLLLGGWRIESSWGGSKSIKVEEYKRPTFTVKIEASKQSLGLNKPAHVTGSAKYYFGQAVSSGEVKWQVKRQAIDLWRYGGRGSIDTLTVASGSSKVDDAGKFKIDFTPKSPKPNQMLGLNNAPQQYAFVIDAEITDSGGETRKATRNFSVGKLGISADISAQQTFGIAGKPYQLSVSRHDLDDSPRAGSAFWELFRVQQPNSPVMPNQELITSKKANNKYATKGDKIKPRWSSTVHTLETTAEDWKDAKKIQQGALKHDESGSAEISLKNLSAGLYRLRYTSKDQWGQVFKTQKAFLIAHQDRKTIEMPALLMTQNSSVEVGSSVNLLLGSAFKQAPTLLEIYHGNKLLKSSIQRGGIKQFNFPVKPEHRGGLSFVLTFVKDYHIIQKEQSVSVPWSNKDLNVSFSTFRDKLQPGQKEKWRITVKDSKNKSLEKGAAEVLASMYDHSLELFTKHYSPNTSDLYSQQTVSLNRSDNLGTGGYLYTKYYSYYIGNPEYKEAQLRLTAQFSQVETPSPVMAPMAASPRRAAPRQPQVDVYALQRKLKAQGYYKGPIDGTVGSDTRAALRKFMSRGEEDKTVKAAQIKDNSGDLDTVKSRTNFNETAFFFPHLILEDNGSVAFEFEVPESLTQWKVWVSAITKDLRGGSTSEFATTSKELMVRPYLPRFLRAGDHANIEVLINNGGEETLNGKLDFDVLNAETLKSIKADFKLSNNLQNFKVEAGKSSRLRFSITAPKDLGMVAIRARATAINGKAKFADGEQRPLPVLPSRIHLSQSRFTALQGNTTKQLQFKELATNTDRTRINDKLVVTVDGQLFYSTLKALPYLAQYPYECTEQTMNRFLSSAIVNSVFKGHPAIASMAKKMAQRKTQFEKWDAVDKDPNNKMLLEETPWLNEAQGGTKNTDDLIRVLDPKVASKQTQKALLKLRKAQNASGGFPWWEGGRESIYMTSYLLHGFSRAVEFKVNVPKDMVKKAWQYLDKEYEKDIRKNLGNHIHDITFINYVLSAYPDASWTGNAFTAQDKKEMLNHSFKKWRELSPLLKAYLALTLKRAGRAQDATLVFDSLMDAAKTDDELGTYWAPEDRSWMWYNDSIDTHAFMLRTMMELNPSDKRRHGLVQWLMLNKKLSHWKSTRATAESIYSLVHYLKQENQLGIEERATIKIGSQLSKALIFKPNEYTGAKNQLLVEGGAIKPDMANISVANQSKSLMFASATWHFSTEELPKSAQGDFFNVTRKFFKRVQKDKDWVLQPLQEGTQIKVGDQLEVQLSLRAKHAAEYVHLRAPRGAGFEPEKQTSGYQWGSRIGYYEEIRDSGANYFFEQLPAGEYAFKYRLRATTAGEFRVAPASVQSIYAPEFNAYSSGKRLSIR